ncbi:MAG: ferrous iron transport protein A, partial [Firmicutes bacterium]|nr:ferrous iron transport protein A [Bacillota bacterium]
MTLDQVRVGQRLRIVAVTDPGVRAQAIRFGLVEGAESVCISKLPKGPVVVRLGEQEIALGSRL